MVELLVVIAVIAILVGLLLPVLSKARSRAQTIQCLNNMKQLQLAWYLYASDNDDRLPPNYPGGDIAGMAPGCASWVSGYLTYETIPEHAPWYADGTNTLKLVPGGHGSIGAYSRTARIYKCPADKSWIMLGGNRYARVRSVTMNCFMNPPYDSPAFYYFRKAADFVSPAGSQVWVFIDEHEDTIRSGWFEISFPTPSVAWWPHFWDGLPASRHNGAGTLVFADGHAEIKKWLDPRTRKPVERKRYVPILEENPDAAWLQERTTRLKSP